MIRASAATVRARIADAVLGAVPATQVGSVSLLAHQADGVARVQAVLKAFGGAVLADDVGLGKTYVALAVARDARSLLVIAPAAVRAQWIEAARRAEVSPRFVSVELLSRGVPVTGSHDLVVIDEAHQLRSGNTRRFALAREICRDARVLLVTATPVQNRLEELRRLVSLFLGERAHAMSGGELARVVVRREHADVAGAIRLPELADPEWIVVADDADCLDRLVALPPPVTAADEGEAGVLLTYTLARQWASSRAALVAALRRRMARARALEDALMAGRHPSRAELAAWHFDDGAQQLAFAELLVQREPPDAPALLRHVRAHRDGVRTLLAWLDGTRDPDATRAAALAALLDRHAGERVVAFSEYHDTVHALWRVLAGRGHVALLSHRGARVASGRVSRAGLLAQFAPDASPRAHDRVDLLLTTDLLSEGVNLQAASVVVHLDLAWNPARLAQRVGRVRRIGAARPRVSSYLFAPPAPSERLLHLEQRLRLKLDEAARSVGIAGGILPGLTAVTRSEASRVERLHARVGRWRSDAVDAAGDGALVAAVASPESATLVCVRQHGCTRLIALCNDAVSEDVAMVEALLVMAEGPDAECPAGAAEQARCMALAHLRRRDVTGVVDLPSLRAGRARRDLLQRVDAISRRSPRHLRPRLSPLMHAARAAASGTLSAGAERVLATLAGAPMPDEAWLQAVGEFAALHARATSGDDAEVIAILLLVRAD